MNPKQLPEGWRMVKFGEMATHISKRVEPSQTDLAIYVGLEHLDPDSLRIKRHGVPGDVDGQKLLVKKGQIIFGKRRAYQRKLGVADWDCICSAHAMVLEANPEIVLPEFLPFFMQSDVFMNRAVTISEGSLSPTIKWKTLAIQEFSLPNIKLQKKILGILNKIEDIIFRVEDSWFTLIKLIELITVHKLVFKDYCEGEFLTISDLFTEIKDRVSPQNFKAEKYVGFEHIIPLCIWQESYSTMEDVNSQKTRFEAGDLLYGKIRPYLRKASIMQFDGLCSSDLIVLKPKRKSYQVLLASLLTSEYFSNASMNTTTGTKMPRADWKQLSQFKLKKLNNNEFDKLSNALSILSQYKIDFQKRKENLISMKMTILAGL